MDLGSESPAQAQVPIANQSYCPPTVREQADFLRRHRDLLAAKIQITKFYPYLIQEKALDVLEIYVTESSNFTNRGRAGKG